MPPASCCAAPFLPGYYPKLFYPKIGKIAESFIPDFTTAYYIKASAAAAAHWRPTLLLCCRIRRRCCLVAAATALQPPPPVLPSSQLLHVANQPHMCLLRPRSLACRTSRGQRAAPSSAAIPAPSRWGQHEACMQLGSAAVLEAHRSTRTLPLCASFLPRPSSAAPSFSASSSPPHPAAADLLPHARRLQPC